MKVRNFTWADLSSLVDLVSLVRESEGDARTVSAESLKEELGRPGLVPEENCTLFEDSEGLKAYSVIFPEPRIGRAVLETGIHPSSVEQGLRRLIIESAIARADALGASLLHICAPSSDSWGPLLEGAGFSLHREYWLMRWQAAEVPSLMVPEGFAVTSMQPGEEERLTRVQNASFEGSWGFCPNTVEEVAYSVSMAMTSPEGIFFLNRGEDTAGHCWTYLFGAPDRTFGVIGMIGIDPAFRGQGLSKPILLAGMNYLHSKGANYIVLDVDAQNAPGIKLYNSVGFQKSMDLHWFEARLSGS